MQAARQKPNQTSLLAAVNHRIFLLVNTSLTINIFSQTPDLTNNTYKNSQTWTRTNETTLKIFLN